MNTTLIAVKKPGHLLAEGFLNRVLTQYPTAFGFGGREGGKLVGEPSKTAIDLTEINELQNVFRDATLVMSFHNFPKANLDEDVQPFTIHREGEALLHVFIDGDFSKYEKDGHDGASNFFVEVVAPRLEQAMEDAKEDNDKFFAELRKPGVQKDMCKGAGERVSITLLPLKGDAISFGDNKIGADFPWGNVSQSLGYAEKAEPEVQPKKNVLSFMRGRSKAEGASPPPPPPVTPGPTKTPEQPVQPEVPVTPAPTPEAAPDTVVEGKTKVFPPAKLHGKARNLWFRTFNGGALPSNHESNQTFVMVDNDLADLAKMSVTDKKAVEGLGREVHRRRKVVGSDVTESVSDNKPSPAVTAAKTAEAAREILIGKGEKPITNGKSTVREAYKPSGQTDNKYLPIMTDEDTTKATEAMVDWMGIPMDKRPSPLVMQKMEQKWPAFSSALGIAFEELLFLPVDRLMTLFDSNKKAVCAFVEMRRKYIEASGIKLDDLLGTLKTDTKGEEPTVTKSEPEPVKKSSLSFLRGKSKAA